METLSNKLTGNDKEMATIPATFFSSVFTKKKMDNMLTAHMSKTRRYLEKLICLKLKKSGLNHSKSPVSDNLHPRILREIKDVQDKPLSILYQRTLSTGMLPHD